jgi:hypothetical protein
MVVADEQAVPPQLVHKIETGMRNYFPQYTWQIVVATGKRENGSQGANLTRIHTPRYGIHHVTFPWHGMPAKTNGYRAIFEHCRDTQSSFCLLVDPTQAGFEATWVDCLMRPGIHSRYDLVTPIYSGGAREQLLSGNLLSPMLRALFGLGARQPMSGEMLLSLNLMNRLLARHDWDSAPARCAPELWISFIAAAEHFQIAESFVSCSKRSRGTATANLPWHTGVAQLFGSLLTLMDQYEQRWASHLDAVDLDRFGSPSPIVLDPNPPDGAAYFAQFAQAFPALRSFWKSVLAPRTFAELETFHRCRGKEPLGDAVWVRVVYEMTAAWKHRALPRRQLLGLFTALYLARVGAFLQKIRWMEQLEVEAELSRLAGYFGALQPVLHKLWMNGTAAAVANDPGSAKVIHGTEAA